MLGLLETNMKHIIYHIYLGSKFIHFFYRHLCSQEMLYIKKRVMNYSPVAMSGDTSLGDGSRAMDH
jgi:hypothetical protein